MKRNIRYTQKEAQDIFEMHGYILKDIYTNNKTKVLTICPKGHEYSVRFDAFNKLGHRCPTCSGNKKHTQEEVGLIFSKEGYVLKDTYRSNKIKMAVTCPVGHFWSVSFNGFFSHGYRCHICYGNKKFTIEEVRFIFLKEGYVVKSNTYEHNRGKLSVVCPEGHEWNTTIFSFNTGYRCPTCQGSRKYTQKEVEDIFSKEGYVLKDTYRNNKTDMLVVCPKGHEFEPSLQDFKNKKSRCGLCSCSSISKPEILLFETIKKSFPDTKRLKDMKVKIDGRPYIHGFDIDIYIPELYRGIEFDGRHYHSFDFMRASKSKRLWPDEDIRNYHELKDSWFASQGIQILHIKEEDWNRNKEECIQKCLDFLGGK